VKWENRGQSRNVTDNRGRGPRGGGGSLAGMGSLGIGGILIVVVIGLILGINPLQLLAMITGGGAITQNQTQTQPQAAPQGNASDQERIDFVSAILDDNQAMWAQMFQESDVPFEEARLNIEDGVVQSQCGMVPEQAGPFYCPLDSTIYLNFNFFSELQNRFGASGDFAEAYVISHEMGHHIQNLLGTADDVRQQQQANPGAANRLSVALELQADCYAGVWGGLQTGGEQGQNDSVYAITQADFNEAMNAAAAIGDDNIQSQTQGSVNPESFTHGSSEQRQQWFGRGFESGDPNQCDTFAAL
jgi:predicted metalloprotease